MSKTFLPQRLEKPLTDKFHSVDEHSEELYQFLSNNLDSGGRPTLDDINFVRTTDKYGRNIFRRTLADYITREKPDFPFKTWMDFAISASVSESRLAETSSRIKSFGKIKIARASANRCF